MSGITYGDGGSNRSIASIYYGDGGTTRVIQKVYYGDNGTNRLVYSAYTPMVVSAPDVSGDSWPGAGVQFGSSTSSVTGGTAPFTILWTFVSGSTFGLSSPTTANCGFIRSGNPPQGTSATGTYRVTYTDATSATAFKDITVFDSRA
jgi:hypothetical protein